MRDNGCSGCKYEHLKGSEKPCCDCANMHMDKYEPITNADRIRNMSDEELGDLLQSVSSGAGNGNPFISLCVDDNEITMNFSDIYSRRRELITENG